MTITTLLSGLPARTMDQTAFDNAMALLMANLPLWGAQVNATEAGMNAIAAGGAYAIPYVYAATSDSISTPAGGFLALTPNGGVQNVATSLFLDLKSANGVVVTSILDTFDLSTSTVKGTVRIVKATDPTKFLLFSVSGKGGDATYRTIAIANIGGSGANPFTAGDAVMLFFQRTGDKGATGAAAAFPLLKVSDSKSAGTAGGSSSVGDQTRTLNTTDWNDIAGASLSSNTITLPAGTYEANIRAPAGNCGSTQVRLYNTADGTYTLIGSSQWISSASNTQIDSTVFGKFTIAAAKTFQVKHYITSSASSTGLGNAGGSGQIEIYAEAIFRKVA